MSETLALRVVHNAVPGRVRLHLPALRRKPRTAARLVGCLEGLSGVRAAQASPESGNLLVLFDPAQTDLRALGREIRRFFGTEPASRPEPEPQPTAPGEQRAPREQYAWAATAPVEAVLRALGTSDADGLTEAEAHRRASAAAGAVDLQGRRPLREILAGQFVSVPNGMLAAAMGVSYFTAGRMDAVVIGAVLLLNGLVGTLTERYAENAIEALRKLGYPQAHVVREGRRRTVQAAEVAPGDLIRLRAGDLVPADARLVEGAVLLDEAMLTGESEPVQKTAEAGGAPRRAHQFTNIVFQGTAVADGRARAVVLTTGRETELGRIQALVSEARAPRTQLQEELDGLGKTLGTGASAICGGLFGAGLLRGQPWLGTLQTAVSLAVSAVPEGLPAVATTSLAVGMKRMLRRQVIIRKLPAVEALGSVTVLCADKTGTLTLNRMVASQYWYDGQEIRYETNGSPGHGEFLLGDRSLEPQSHPALDGMLKVGVLCNETKLRRENGGLHVSGSATEGALLLSACAAGHWFEDLRERYPLQVMHRRSESHLRMASVHEHPEGGLLVAVKGAPEAVLELCTHRLDPDGKPAPLGAADRSRYLKANEAMAEDGLRVLAFAQARKPAESLHNGHLEGLIWLGLVGLEDPIRRGVKEAIGRCRQAGVRTVILTGDQRGTALAVARTLGFETEREGVLEAPDLSGMSAEEVRQTVERTAVYARVTPEDKLRIVRALQENGHVVAMTGDGINDGPALKAADIGIAMGEGSSDVARELADVVLTRNDFGAIVAAVEQGRVLFSNIRRTLRYLIGSNLSELMIAAAGLAGGLPFPFRPIQLLWLNLVSDVFPALALALEPTDQEVMRQPPRRPGSPLIGRRDWAGLFLDGGLMAGGALGAYLWAARRYGFGPAASSVAFTAITFAQALYSLACSGRAELPGRDKHAALWSSVAGTMGLQLAANHWGPLRRLLHGTPLGLADYGVVLLAAVLPWSLAAGRSYLPARLASFGPPANQTAGRRKR